MAASPNNTPSGVPVTGLPTRLPHHMTFEEEFVMPVALGRSVCDRLVHLVDIIDREQRNTLPKSRLSLVGEAGGSLLFKGGRNDG